jgi:hypothetical protein
MTSRPARPKAPRGRRGRNRWLPSIDAITVHVAARAGTAFPGFLAVLALIRTLPPGKDLKTFRALGEQLALGGPYDATLSGCLDLLAVMAEEDAGR